MNKVIFAVLILLSISSVFAYPTVQVLEKQTQPVYKPVYTAKPVATIPYDVYQEAYLRGYDDGKHHRRVYSTNCYDAERTYVSCNQRTYTYKYTPFVYWSTS